MRRAASSTSSIHPTFDPSAASESECSEHPTDGAGSKTHSERTKRPRKKKTLDRFPKLTVLSANETMVECQLETVKQKTITFKFDITDNDALDVANKLVMTNLLPGNHSEVVTTYISDIMQQLKANPKVLPVVSTPGLDTRPGQQPSQDCHHRSPSGSRRHRDDSDAARFLAALTPSVSSGGSGFVSPRQPCFDPQVKSGLWWGTFDMILTTTARYLARKLSRSSPKRRRRHGSVSKRCAEFGGFVSDSENAI
ncbi:Serine/threonine-protein kinase WNK2 [Chionoecetes opilio]|uniref:Serine/threonine-protein kinase WNK2 n=1 Tax=Chionoecetes opilio TaxID=41210 RepID=A0A8J4XWQ3_CHIOP|nr:Serine/threonine-protein kinase WNK2 [Chionoecetes opilio]